MRASPGDWLVVPGPGAHILTAEQMHHLRDR